MKTYKGILVVFASLILNQVAFGAEVPHCWDKPRVIDGSFNVTVKVIQVTKEHIIDILANANSANIRANFPIIIGTAAEEPLLFMNINAQDSSTDPFRLPKEKLIAEVKKQLQPIANIEGVTIECNYRITP